jgi:hypothetical protein
MLGHIEAFFSAVSIEAFAAVAIVVLTGIYASVTYGILRANRALLTQMREEHRVAVRAQRFQTYAARITSFIDLARLMIEHPELHDLYQNSRCDNKSYDDMSPSERSKIHYCDAVIALCETVWRARKEQQVEEDEWGFWRQWALGLAGSSYFVQAIKWAREGREYEETFLTALAPKKGKP